MSHFKSETNFPLVH